MGNSIYYGIYPKECNNDKVLPYLDVDNICIDLNISRDSQKEFFNILRKYSIEKRESVERDLDLYYYHCFIITNYEDYFNFYNEVNIVLPEDIECDFDNDILIFWVAWKKCYIMKRYNETLKSPEFVDDKVLPLYF